MDKVCPICNGMAQINVKCPCCGQDMQDGGAVEDYLGPYSPYFRSEMAEDVEKSHCVHLLTCPHCGYDTRSAWALISM